MAKSFVFHTERGSRYTVVDITKTKRFKVYIPEHGVKDQGEQATSDLTVYLDEKGFLKFADVHSGPDSWLATIETDGAGLYGYWSQLKTGAAWKQHIKGVPFYLLPQVGLAPLEFWKSKMANPEKGKLGFSQWHIGHKIVSLEYKEL